MKSRWTTYLLLAAVAAVWGLVAWKICAPAGAPSAAAGSIAPGAGRAGSCVRYAAARLSRPVPEGRRTACSGCACGRAAPACCQSRGTPARAGGDRPPGHRPLAWAGALYPDRRGEAVRTAAGGSCRGVRAHGLRSGFALSV